MEKGKLAGGYWYSQHIKVKQFIRQRDNYTCQICGAEGWIVDHIIPWRVSHDSSIDNLRVLCHSCNLATRCKPYNVRPSIDEWEKRLREELSSVS